jgi:hypothetical protein
VFPSQLLLQKPTQQRLVRDSGSPRKLLRKLAQQTGMSYSSRRKVAETLQLLPSDCEKRHHYYEWLFVNVVDPLEC